MIEEKKFKIELMTLEPLRIGGKQDPLSGADNPVTRIGDKLVIPGSSLKGAFRAEVESFLINLYREEWQRGEKLSLQPCIPVPTGRELSEDEKQLVSKKNYRAPGCHYPCDEKKCSKSIHSICPVCYLFGAAGLNGFLRVPFLYASISPDTLYSTRIDRAKGVVAKGTNRPYELVSDGTLFSGELEILLEDDILGWKLGELRSLKDKTLGDQWLRETDFNQEKIMKDLIIERLKAISILGGYKSKGCGKIKIEIEEVKS